MSIFFFFLRGVSRQDFGASTHNSPGRERRRELGPMKPEPIGQSEDELDETF